MYHFCTSRGGHCPGDDDPTCCWQKNRSTPVQNEIDENDIVYRLRKRAEIRRQIPTRKSVQNGERDRIADLLEEAADEIERLRG